MYINISKDGSIYTIDCEGPTFKYESIIRGLNYNIHDLWVDSQEFDINNMQKYYSTSYKKKATGGKRRIDSPCEGLKAFMRKLVNLFDRYNYLIPSNVYSFTKDRNTKGLVNDLVKNASNAFMKVDIKDFFGSCKYEALVQASDVVYPFCMIDKHMWLDILKVCVLNGSLPQGAPSSPFLSNLVMVAIDYSIGHKAFKNGWHYARFADDLWFSSNNSRALCTNIPKLKIIIVSSLEFYGQDVFRINESKTKTIKRSKCNGFWILGMMLPKNNVPTIGHDNKQLLKASIFSFLADAKHKKYWDKEKVFKLQGKISYASYIEPGYVDLIIKKYEEKLDISFSDTIKAIICS